jgi:hypothetical protein
MARISKKMAVSKKAIQAMQQTDLALSKLMSESKRREAVQYIKEMAWVIIEQTDEVLSILQDIEYVVDAYRRELQSVLN